MVERKAFLTKPKHQNHVSQWKEHVYNAQSQKRMMAMTWIQVYPIWWMNFDSKKDDGKKAFLAKPKHQNHVSQWKKHVLV